MSVEPSLGRANRPGEPPLRVAPTGALPIRKTLGHEIPSWVKIGSPYFVTICARRRGFNTLATPEIGPKLISSVRFHHERLKWYARVFVVMPDHVHALLAFPADGEMRKAVTAWKSFTARQLGIEWQPRFFDHRIRSEEAVDEKVYYILDNPVRAGLCATAGEWPYLFHASSAESGSAGTPRPTINEPF